MAYIALCILKADKTSECEIVTTRGVCFTLTQNSTFNRSALENLRTGLLELNNTTCLSISPFKNDFIVDWSSFEYTELKTSQIPVFAVRKIINGKFSAERCRLLRYALALMSTFDSVNSKGLTAKIGIISLDRLSRMVRSDIKTVQMLNRKLQEMNIISIYNRYLTLGLDTSVNDFYAYGWEKEQLEEYAKRQYKDKYVPVKNKDKKKKIAQMYNAVAKGTSYDKDTMIFLYNYIKRQNDYHMAIYYAEDKYKWTIRRDHRAKVKSLKPFMRFKYIYEKENR